MTAVSDSTPPPPSIALPRSLVALALMVTLALFFYPLESDKLRPFTEKLSDAAHFPLFFAITLALSFLLGGKLRISALVALNLVFTVEVLQPLTGRSLGEVDIVNGCFGVACATLGAALWQSGARLWKGGIYGLFVLWVVFIVFTPAIRAYQAILLRIRMFPLLGSFEDPIELALWRTTGPILTSPNYLGRTQSWSKNGRSALVFLSKGDGVAGFEYSAGDTDWSDYQTLIIPLTLTSGPAEISVRIDDDQDCSDFDNRFNRFFPLEPGEHEIRIPLAEVRDGPVNRQLNMTRIRRMVIFTHPHVLARQLFFDAIRLEPSPFLPPLGGEKQGAG